MYVDKDGNLKSKGQIPLQMGLPHGQQDAQIVDACLQLVALANTRRCPIVCENLDFSRKKEQLKECGSKYARMISGWAYSRFFQLLESPRRYPRRQTPGCLYSSRGNGSHRQRTAGVSQGKATGLHGAISLCHFRISPPNSQ